MFNCCRGGAIIPGLAVVAMSVLGPQATTAQPTDDLLREQLASAQEGERTDLLVELTLRDAREDPGQAVIWGREALGLLVQAGDLRGEIRVRNALSMAYLKRSQHRECMSHADQAARSARMIDDREGLAEALLMLGRAHWYLTEIHRSFRCYDEAVQLFSQLDNRAALAGALMGRCHVQSRRGHYPEALQDCLRSRDLYQEVGDPDGLAKALRGIGNISFQLGQPDEALRHYLHLLDLKRPDDTTIGSLLNNIGFVYTEIGELDSAVEYLTQALELEQQLGNENRMIRALNNLGTAYQRLGDPEKALSYFRSALEKASGAGLKRGRSSALANIGLVQQDLGNDAAAIELFEQAIDILHDTGESRNLRSLYDVLSAAYAEAGQYEQALQALRESSVLKREAYDHQAGQARAELQARFESEQQQRELELLHRKQAVADLKLRYQKDVQRFIAVGCVLFLAVVLLWIHRARLSAQAAAMEETVRRKRALNDRLRELDKLKDEFLANTSHELKTPLHGITGLAETLLSGAVGKLPAAARSSLEALMTSGRQLSQRIDDILDFSELNHRRDLVETGKDQPQLETETADLQQRLGLVGSIVPVESAGKSLEEPPEHTATSFPFGEPRVLVVDDEPINLHVISGYLAPEGFEITAVTNGEEAIRRLETQSFDLVLLDVMMPEFSGFDVCRSLRQKYGLAELPVIFLTVKGRDSDLVNGKAAGANDYLTKPVSKDRLLARLRPHLELFHLHRNREELVAEKISEVKILSGLLPICGFCKKIRDDQGFWSEVELFIDSHSEAEFNQGICPECNQPSGTRIQVPN